MPYENNEDLRNKIIGLGESSVRKSYYPQLQDRIVELERFHGLLDRSRELIFLVDAQSLRIIDNNAIVCSTFEASKESLIGSELAQWFPSPFMDVVYALSQKHEHCSIVETIIENSSGTIPMEFVLQYVNFSAENYYVILGKDISERKRAESKIHTLAFYDSLTQLANRQLLHDRMAMALAKSQRSHKVGALLMIDLDNFKALNDTKGHHIGDELLIQVAKRLQSVLREGDTLARMSGDEFIILLEGLHGEEEKAALEAEKFATRIKYLLNEPYNLLGYEHTCSSSIGIALFNTTKPKSKETLLKQADIAMYQAKKLGRNRICFYDPVMQENIEQKTTMEHELRIALSQEELTLFYQPQVNLEGEIIGVEALIRWNHPQKGLVPPNAFISLAEETGLIIPIGSWVLHKACEQLSQWTKRYPKRQLHVSINVSVKQFQEASFYDTVAEVIAKYGVETGRVKLELTESLIVENIHETIQKIESLRSLGIGFSLDDFGTGYSSLSYLKRLPLDELKIDQSFVRDISNDNNDAMIVKTIIEMAHNFDLDVIAEGVEDQEQFKFLEENGCTLFQGYLFGKPMPAKEIERLFLDV